MFGSVLTALRGVNWTTKVAEWVIAFALLVGAYFWVSHSAATRAVEEYKAEQLVLEVSRNNEIQRKYNEVSTEYETLKAKRQKNDKTRYIEVEKIVRDVVYSRDCFTDDGLRVANEAIAGTTNSGKPDGELPSVK